MAAEVFRIEIPIHVSDQTDPGVSKASKKMNAFDKVNEKVQQRLNKMNSQKYRVLLDAYDRASSVIGKVSTTAKGLAGKTWRVTLKAVDMATAPLRGILNIFKNPLFQIGAAIGVTVGIKDTIDTYVGFEKSMSKVKALVNMTSSDIDGDMELLTAKAREMGRSTTKSASEAADALGYMALAGWDTQTMLTAIEPTLRLSEAGNLDLARTSDLVTDSMSALGLAANDLQGYLDKVAKTSGIANTDIDVMMEAFLELGGTIKQNNIPLEEAGALVGILANRGVKGSEAGIALNSVLINLTTGAGQAGKAMEELGLSAFNSDGSFKGYATTLKELNERTKDMTDEQKAYYLSAIGGKMRLSHLQKLLAGVSDEYDELKDSIADSSGALEEMARIMNDNVYGDMKALQSAADDVKIAFMDRLQPYLRSFLQWFTQKMPDIQKAMDGIADSIGRKIDHVTRVMNDFMESDEWQNADIWGKIGIAWDKIIAEPFSEWWASTGKAWFADKAAQIGEGIGSGLTAGLLALLGFDLSSAVTDGASIGASFAEGFAKGFDGKKVGDAILNAIKNVFKDAGTLLPGGKEASSTSGLSAMLLAFTGGKLLKGGASIAKGIGGLFGKGSNAGLPGIGQAVSAPVGLMNVTAKIVNIYGGIVNSGSKLGSAAAGAGGSAAGHMIGGTAAKALTSGGGAAVLTGSTQTLLTGSTAAGSATKGLAGIGGWMRNILLGKEAVIGTDGALVSSGGVIGGLSSVATGLGSGATTLGGAAAVGGGSILGAIGGALGIGSGLWDIFKGTQKKGKEAQDSYFSGGTKLGMVGGGAAAGAAVGSIFGGVGAAPGALIGAGIGGIGALAGGSKIGKWLSDAVDEGGWLNSTGKEVSKFFTTTLPSKWNSFWGGVGGFFTESIPKWWGKLTEPVSVFFTETLPEKWNEFWESVGDFFTESVPYAIGYAIGKTKIFFTEDLPAFFGELWNSISIFFTATLPAWASDLWNNKIVPFFTVSIPGFFGNLWNSISTFFTSTLPAWASDLWNNKIVPFFTESIPAFFSTLWETISAFFTATLPAWASDIWNNRIVPFFTESIPAFFGNLWDRVNGFFTATLPEIVSGVWDSIKGFFTDALPNFFKDVWGSITSHFSEGYADATGSSESVRNPTPHAWGGIMTKPHMGIVAEAGPESIIPLSPSKRGRGIELWEKTGQSLGVMPYEDGGIVGDAAEPDGAVQISGKQSGNAAGTNNISIHVELKPEIHIDGSAGDENAIFAVLKKRIRELADDLSDELAERLAMSFFNMPKGV